MRLGSVDALNIDKPVPLERLSFRTPPSTALGAVNVSVSVDTGGAGPKRDTLAAKQFFYYPVPIITRIFPTLGSTVGTIERTT